MNVTAQAIPSNFAFLAKRYPQLERIGALSERYFSDDPIVSLITVRQFGEMLAQLVAARSGLFTDANEQQAELLRRLRVDGNYPRNVLDLFHQLRIDGNAAHIAARVITRQRLRASRWRGSWLFGFTVPLMMLASKQAHFSPHVHQSMQRPNSQLSSVD
jgi:hypothetical protein